MGFTITRITSPGQVTVPAVNPMLDVGSGVAAPAGPVDVLNYIQSHLSSGLGGVKAVVTISPHPAGGSGPQVATVNVPMGTPSVGAFRQMINFLPPATDVPTATAPVSLGQTLAPQSVASDPSNPYAGDPSIIPVPDTTPIPTMYPVAQFVISHEGPPEANTIKFTIPVPTYPVPLIFDYPCGYAPDGLHSLPGPTITADQSGAVGDVAVWTGDGYCWMQTVYAGGKWVVVGVQISSGGTVGKFVATSSTDQSTWSTPQAISRDFSPLSPAFPGFSYVRLAYGGGKFVSCSTGSTQVGSIAGNPQVDTAVSSDGASWSFRSLSDDASAYPAMNGLIYTGAEFLILFGDNGSVTPAYVTSSDGSTWSGFVSSASLSNGAAAVASSGSSVIVLARSYGLYRSTTLAADSWSLVASAPPAGYTFNYGTPLVWDGSRYIWFVNYDNYGIDPDAVYFPNGTGAFVSEDDGLTWVQKDIALVGSFSVSQSDLDSWNPSRPGAALVPALTLSTDMKLSGGGQLLGDAHIPGGPIIAGGTVLPPGTVLPVGTVLDPGGLLAFPDDMVFTLGPVPDPAVSPLPAPVPTPPAGGVVQGVNYAT